MKFVITKTYRAYPIKTNVSDGTKRKWSKSGVMAYLGD
jgi:hypothetical protein